MLEEIKSPRWRPQVQAVRAAYAHGGKDEAAAPKKKLPGILFSGTFAKRSAAALLQASGLICVDLDDLGEGVEGMRDHIAADPHTLAAFVSPTGTGLKVIFRCDPKRPHIESFKAAEQFVKLAFGLEIDQACKDVSRICFVSHDPDAFVADDAELLPYNEHAIVLPHRELQHVQPGDATTPGDDYDTRGDFQDLLRNHGWTEARGPYWTRPGATGRISASWDVVPGRFYVFSDQAAPLQPQHVYRPWHIYALLECGGDFKEAARRLGKLGYGEQRSMGAPLTTNAIQNNEIDAGDDQTTSAVPAKPVEVQKTETGQIVFTMPSRSLFDFDLIKDGHESILLGDRYLNRGDGAVLVSTSGMGKSSASIQMATELALNLGPFGIQGNGALKSLIMQSEDSEGDIAEVAFSMRHVLKLTPAQVADVNSKVRIVTDRVNRGKAFIAHLKKHITEFAPDLVIINPLQAFMDGDVTESKDIGQFLREGLNGLNEPAKFAYIIIHHTTKPAKAQPNTKAPNWHEVMYDMAGGAEIINWARAIISLRAATEEGDFNMVLAKRGRRAGVTRKVPLGTGWTLEPVTTIPLRHTKGRVEVPGIKRGLPLIYWESRDPDAPSEKTEKSGGRPEKYQFNDYRTLFPGKNTPGKPINEIHRSLLQNGEIQKKILHNVLRRWADQLHIEIISVHGAPNLYRALV